ncbi:hypothetical protein MMC14_001632 [Varicellaria rhodocarpa]|nr:hypothetical protein [Varicellaria rhodocarpa]
MFSETLLEHAEHLFSVLDPLNDHWRTLAFTVAQFRPFATGRAGRSLLALSAAREEIVVHKELKP